MLGEETLIVVAAFVACAFLVLGVLELLWPTQTQRRRPVPPRAARPHRQSARVRHTRDRGRPPYVRRQPPLTPSPVPLAPLAASVLPIAATPFETENPEALIAEVVGFRGRPLHWAEAREKIDSRDPKVAAVIVVLKKDAG